MGRLEAAFAPSFSRDIKRLKRKHYDLERLDVVLDLILENSEESIAMLIRRHNMHLLLGSWAGRFECHVCNIGDWLLIWKIADNVAVFQRTGTHDELFK